MVSERGAVRIAENDMKSIPRRSCAHEKTIGYRRSFGGILIIDWMLGGVADVGDRNIFKKDRDAELEDSSWREAMSDTGFS